MSKIEVRTKVGQTVAQDGTTTSINAPGTAEVIMRDGKPFLALEVPLSTIGGYTSASGGEVILAYINGFRLMRDGKPVTKNGKPVSFKGARIAADTPNEVDTTTEL